MEERRPSPVKSRIPTMTRRTPTTLLRSSTSPKQADKRSVPIKPTTHARTRLCHRRILLAPFVPHHPIVVAVDVLTAVATLLTATLTVYEVGALLLAHAAADCARAPPLVRVVTLFTVACVYALPVHVCGINIVQVGFLAAQPPAVLGPGGHWFWFTFNCCIDGVRLHAVFTQNYSALRTTVHLCFCTARRTL